jgi:hypothetical protein
VSFGDGNAILETNARLAQLAAGEQVSHLQALQLELLLTLEELGGGEGNGRSCQGALVSVERPLPERRRRVRPKSPHRPGGSRKCCWLSLGNGVSSGRSGDDG